MEHELPGVLDGVDEPVTVEELEGVVRRAEQRRRATLVAGAAGLLLCGAVVGALARGPGDERPTGFAGPPAEDHPPKPPMIATMQDGGPTGLPLTPLFRRETSGVAIRVYRASWGEKSSPLDKCAPPDFIQGELSNTAAVGFAMAPLLPGETFALLGAGSFGQGEGQPVTWAAVRAGTGVSTVRLRVGEATDLMAPHAGITLLAAPGKPVDGVVEGLDPDGKVVATQPLTALSHLPMDPSCSPPDCVVDGGGGKVGSAETGSPAPTVAPSQGATGAVPARPAKPPLDQAGDPAPEPGDPRGPLLKVEKGFACGAMPKVPGVPPPAIPVPDKPLDGSSGPATTSPPPAALTATVAPTTTDASPTSTASPNQAP